MACNFRFRPIHTPCNHYSSSRSVVDGQIDTGVIHNAHYNLQLLALAIANRQHTFIKSSKRHFTSIPEMSSHFWSAPATVVFNSQKSLRNTPAEDRRRVSQGDRREGGTISRRLTSPPPPPPPMLLVPPPSHSDTANGTETIGAALRPGRLPR